ncbi:hypothetical protein [Wenxinia marina]|uniref:Wenxma_17, whole genome shotgun sequence n=1 Tax=Wenxinia marina DSM 24838 TaxID=1123501 RepID=A0A0D0Q6B0_9RHOB|nr:hypothetical protein [Wenxinia marina]KIQ67997.1 hypothetical protein Wenmar_03452 [Wenxinia marina DSM 24838]GGL75516.1 hypothetical protein GCM10011392_32730 [Wenxinia marina]
MKVTGDTPERLTLERRPWILGLAIIAFTLLFVGIGAAGAAAGEIAPALAFGLGGLFIGGVAFAAFVRRTQVIFDRAEGSVTIRTRSVMGYRESVHALDDVAEAVLQISRSSKGSDTRRPALRVADGTVPLVPVYVSGRGPRRVVTAINDWLGRAVENRRSG